MILWLSICAAERLYVPCLCADILSNGCAVSVCLRARASVFACRCACASVFVSLCVGVGCRSVCLKKACAVVRTLLRVCVSLYQAAVISPCLFRDVALCVAASICLLCMCLCLSIPLVLHRWILRRSDAKTLISSPCRATAAQRHRHANSRPHAHAPSRPCVYVVPAKLARKR